MLCLDLKQRKQLIENFSECEFWSSGKKMQTQLTMLPNLYIYKNKIRKQTAKKKNYSNDMVTEYVYVHKSIVRTSLPFVLGQC